MQSRTKTLLKKYFPNTMAEVFDNGFEVGIRRGRRLERDDVGKRLARHHVGRLHTTSLSMGYDYAVRAAMDRIED